MRMIFRDNDSRLGRQKATTSRVRCQVAMGETASGQPSQYVNDSLYRLMPIVNNRAREGVQRMSCPTNVNMNLAPHGEKVKINLFLYDRHSVLSALHSAPLVTSVLLWRLWNCSY